MSHRKPYVITTMDNHMTNEQRLLQRPRRAKLGCKDSTIGNIIITISSGSTRKSCFLCMANQHAFKP
jgi:hypothetical protein